MSRKDELIAIAETLLAEAVIDLTGASAELAQKFAMKVLALLEEGGDDAYVLREVERQLPLVANACGLATTNVTQQIITKLGVVLGKFILAIALSNLGGLVGDIE